MSSDTSDNHISISIIIGSIIGGTALILIVGIVVWRCYRWSSSESSDYSGRTAVTSSPMSQTSRYRSNSYTTFRQDLRKHDSLERAHGYPVVQHPLQQSGKTSSVYAFRMPDAGDISTLYPGDSVSQANARHGTILSVPRTVTAFEEE